MNNTPSDLFNCLLIKQCQIKPIWITGLTAYQNIFSFTNAFNYSGRRYISSKKILDSTILIQDLERVYKDLESKLAPIIIDKLQKQLVLPNDERI